MQEKSGKKLVDFNNALGEEANAAKINALKVRLWDGLRVRVSLSLSLINPTPNPDPNRNPKLNPNPTPYPNPGRRRELGGQVLHARPLERMPRPRSATLRVVDDPWPLGPSPSGSNYCTAHKFCEVTKLTNPWTGRTK